MAKTSTLGHDYHFIATITKLSSFMHVGANPRPHTSLLDMECWGNDGKWIGKAIEWLILIRKVQRMGTGYRMDGMDGEMVGNWWEME